MPIFNPTTGGKVQQFQISQVTGYVPASALMTVGDVIPQQSQGTEISTVSITPLDAANLLIVEAQIWFSSSALASIVAALFRDATLDSIGSVICDTVPTAGYFAQAIVKSVIVAGAVTPTTFKVRIGPEIAANLSINGLAGARVLGGAGISYISVMEISP